MAPGSVPTEHMSSVEETGVKAFVLFTTRPQLGSPDPSTACVIAGCVAQKPGVRVKQLARVVVVAHVVGVDA